ncbi:hypothetical protein REPUB_Repub04eG0143200 [Reevesia pubescens]
MDVMRNVFAMVWKLQQGLLVLEVGDKLYMFMFEDENECNRVLETQPWSFDKALLVVKEIDAKSSPSTKVITFCLFFWVQFHGLPLTLMIENIGIVLGDSLGDVLEIHTTGDHRSWGKFLHVKVTINVTKPS